VLKDGEVGVGVAHFIEDVRGIADGGGEDVGAVL
jgi:hypothetical protein